MKNEIFSFNYLARLYQYRKVYDVSMRYLSPGKDALDWGCGNGHFAYFLLQQHVRTTGFSFDPPPDYLLSRPDFLHARGHTDDPVSLPFPDATFDLVFSIGVLEHVHETGGTERASLAEIWRILKPGGYFLCFHFPNRYGWTEPLCSALGVAKYFHKRKYTREQIRSMAADGRFDLLEWGRYNFLPRNELTWLPAAVSDTIAGAAAFNSIDAIMAKCFPIFTQNHYFVCQKPPPIGENVPPVANRH
ncbi:MAG TPA: class I SAM-dependent methyltransferase [Nitrospiraceae bacterium]|nr:class I SAM-dependent methyltransferase [Nitrospiraceae bacterium]